MKSQAARTKWKWAGHVARMIDNRWTKTVNDWCPYDRTRTGRPSTRWRDDIVKYETMGWQRNAQDRHCWMKCREEGFIRQ